jgi:predicted branched-subunit amino acid permease
MTAASPAALERPGLGTARARRRSELLRGVRAMLPIIVGYLPFAVVIGTTLHAASLPTAAKLASTPAMLTGAGQLATVQLLATGAPAIAVVATGMVVSARFALYSALLAPAMRVQPLWFRLVASHLLVDATYAVARARLDDGDADSDVWRWHYLGASLSLGGMWVGVISAVALLGGVVPPSWPLEFAVVAAFAGLLVPTMTGRPAVAAASTGAVVAVGTSALVGSAALLVGAVAGMAAGVIAEGRRR